MTSVQSPAFPSYQAPAFPNYQAPSFRPSSPSYSPFSSPASVNPYTSPAPTYAPYGQQSYGGGGRRGLPWDVRDQSFGTWFETLGAILGGPAVAFRSMHVSGGLGRPIMYAMFGMGIGQVGPLLMQMALLAIAAARRSPHRSYFAPVRIFGVRCHLKYRARSHWSAASSLRPSCMLHDDGGGRKERVTKRRFG